MRNAMKQVEKDSVSLMVHRDTTSLVSRSTNNSSKLSMVFGFDRELFVSKVYGRVFRGSVKESLRRQQGISEVLEAKERNKAINRGLTQDMRRLQRECKILLLGTSDSRKSDVVKNMKLTQSNGYTREERALYKLTIYENVVDNAKALLEAMGANGVQLDNTANRQHCDLLRNYVLGSDPHRPLEPWVGQAIKSIWQDASIQALVKRRKEFHLEESTL